jgi:AraC-like DNA-binding protein
MLRVRSRASVSVVLVRPLVVALVGSPAALAAFYAATDLTPEMLADDEARVSPAQFCVAWAEASRLSRDPTLALSIAEATPAGAFGIVEYVCRAAPTVEKALSQWVRYLGILDDAVEVGLVEAGKDAALRVLRESEAPAPASHELCFALVAKQARALMVGGFRVTTVRFTHRKPVADISPYRKFFDADVVFGAAQTELVMPKSVLAGVLTTRDPNLAAILIPTAEQQRERRTTEPPLTEQVRRRLVVALSSDDAQLEHVAKQLGMTARSLQRRLKDEGSSFQDLRDEARRRLADRYLGESHSMSEISFLLGFSEPSAFFRAFKRWTGLTPIERRQQRRAGALGDLRSA